MQNEPQLSEEMEKRYNAIMLEWIESQWKIEQAHQAREPYTRMKFEADASKVEDKLKHFLATALEEQKKKAVLDYIMSLGWQDTENEYVKEVLADAEKLASELTQKKEDTHAE